MPTDKGVTSPRPFRGADRLHLVGLKITSFQFKTAAEATLCLLRCFLYCIENLFDNLWVKSTTGMKWNNNSHFEFLVDTVTPF